MKFKDKVAIVTGASSGIGRTAAIAFAKEGAKVAVVARRTEQAEETVSIIKNAEIPLLSDLLKASRNKFPLLLELKPIFSLKNLKKFH